MYLTRDDVAVMLHDGTLNATTNVVAYAALHPDILELRSADGSYDVTTCTYTQVQQLTATFRNAPGYGSDRRYYVSDVHYQIATLAEVTDLAYDHFRSTGLQIGAYPEAKQSGLAVADAILAMLNDSKYDGYFSAPGGAVLQSFDPAQVAYLNRLTAIPVTLLGVCPASADQAVQIAGFADGVGPSTSQTGAACVQFAHNARLFVHSYTSLNDPAQYAIFYNYGVDGVFTNFADIAEAGRNNTFRIR